MRDDFYTAFQITLAIAIVVAGFMLFQPQEQLCSYGTIIDKNGYANLFVDDGFDVIQVKVELTDYFRNDVGDIVNLCHGVGKIIPANYDYYIGK